MGEKTSSSASDNRKLVGPLAIVFDLGLAVLFFLWMHVVTYSHTGDVPTDWKKIGSAYAALALTLVFWLALQGLRVTLVDQMRRKGIPS